MGAGERLPGAVSAAEVMKKIDATAYGEYDFNHEWNPCFDLSEKLEVLGSLLDSWDSTEAGGRPPIVQFARTLAAEARYAESMIAEALVPRALIPEVSALVEDSLDSAWFCLALMESMKARGLKHPRWLAAIRDNWANLRFRKDKRGVPLKELYGRVGAALDAAGDASRGSGGDDPPVRS